MVCCRSRVWIAKEGYGSKIVRALYGLKSSGASWRAMFTNTIRDMGLFEPTIAKNPDAYRRAFAKPDGFKYYEYIRDFVGDVLIISHTPQIHLERIKATHKLNPSSIGTPSRYLGADVERVTRPGDPTGRIMVLFSTPICAK